MFRLSTLKVARKSFVFKGVQVVAWGANAVRLGGDWSSSGDQKGETLWGEGPSDASLALAVSAGVKLTQVPFEI
jgi:hypothetical protein